MSETDLKKVYGMFTSAWKFFRKYVDMPDNDESWERAVSESGQIANEYGNGKLVRDLLSATIGELERKVSEVRNNAESQRGV